MRHILGTLSLMGAVVALIAGLNHHPSASTCQLINGMDPTAHCSAAMRPGYWITAAVLAFIALLCFAPSILGTHRSDDSHAH